MDWLITFMRDNPVIPLFLTVGLGFWLGKLRIGSFSLGAVAATLVVGVVVGQMKIVIPDMLKTVFFLFFLFAIGYNVGPQFFRSFRGPGVRMVGFAVVEALICAGLVIAAAHLTGYNNGVAAGLFAGSQTVSASLGLLADTVREVPMDDSARSHLLRIIPACYAVTYVFGTIGTAWFLSTVGPKIMGGLDRVKNDVAHIEQSMDKSSSAISAPGFIPAQRQVIFRAYDVTSSYFDSPRTVCEIQKMYTAAGTRVIVERARINGVITDVTDDTVISHGDHVVLGGRADALVSISQTPGAEITDAELLNFGAERTPVTIARGKIDGITVEQLRQSTFMERVFIASIKRNGLSIPLKLQTELHAGDQLTLVGWPRDIAEAADAIGYADRPTDRTDMVFMGLGLAAGCIIGAISLKIKGIPMSLGYSVGSLIAGLFLGWFRTRHPSFGHIPSSAVWLLNNLGINMFIAILGITAGASLMLGISEAGIKIIGIGALLTLVGLVINIFIARKIFRFSTPVTLGCVAGGRCCVAAIGAIQDTLQSDVPNLGYTVTYAVGNISLVFSSLLVLFLT